MPKSKRILITDDDPAIEEMVQAMVEYVGYETIVTSNVQYLLDMKGDELPDLILLDVWMKGIDGREICRQLKERVDTRHIPVIIISASKGIHPSVMAAGADAFVEKPFEMVTLLDKIEEFLGDRE